MDWQGLGEKREIVYIYPRFNSFKIPDIQFDGRLAQLVQSVRLTRVRSQVRIPQRPQVSSEFLIHPLTLVLRGK